jgi:hypothetical protein
MFLIDEIVETAPVIAEAVSYLTKKVDSKTRDIKVLQPTIATQTVSISCWKIEVEINNKIIAAANEKWNNTRNKKLAASLEY